MEGFVPFFSVIVPTFNRPRQLTTCLNALENLNYPRDRFEVIVVDDGSQSSPAAIIREFCCRMRIAFITQAHGGPAAARNAGAQHARGQFLAFTGDDCVPGPDWLTRLADRFDQQPDCALGGRVINGLSGNTWSAATHLLILYLYDYYNACPEDARFFTPNNLAVPAACFSELGGFDPSFNLGAGEDREFCDRWRRRGYRMSYAVDAAVYHNHELNFRKFLRLHSNYGRGTRQYRETLAHMTGRRVHLEPLSFYFNLLRYPFLQREKKGQARLALLLAISQIANAVGYMSQGFDRRFFSRKSR